MTNPTTIEADDVRAILRLIPWLKALIAGAFALGVWTTALQLRVSALEVWRADHSAETVEWRKWRADVSGDLREMKSDVNWIRRSLAAGKAGTE